MINTYGFVISAWEEINSTPRGDDQPRRGQYAGSWRVSRAEAPGHHGRRLHVFWGRLCSPWDRHATPFRFVVVATSLVGHRLPKPRRGATDNSGLSHSQNAGFSIGGASHHEAPTVDKYTKRYTWAWNGHRVDHHPFCGQPESLVSLRWDRGGVLRSLPGCTAGPCGAVGFCLIRRNP